MAIFQYIEWLAIAIFLIAFLFSIPALLRFFKGLGKTTKFENTNARAKFAVIIPARDESRVVEANIKSVLQSDYPAEKREIYIIVESETDKTVSIAAKYERTRVFVRRQLDRAGKGYALDECLTDIFARDENYDAFLILDADNLISRDFLSRMNEAYQSGYDLACGKRDNKDWNASVVSAASGLTFTALNAIINKPKTFHGDNIVISGTGFFIRADKLRALGGWKFYSLTEDYEITTHAACEGWKTAYIDEAVYYDEQPVKLGQSIVQRSRWVKGFFTVRGKYAKKKREARARRKANENTALKQKAKRAFLSGTVPVLTLCFDLIAYLVCLCVAFILSLFLQNGEAHLFGFRLLQIIAIAYILLALLTVWLLFMERKTMQMNVAMKIKAVLFHPVFLFTYVFAAVRAIFMPNVWEKIEHTIYKEI